MMENDVEMEIKWLLELALTWAWARDHRTRQKANTMISTLTT